MQLFYIRDENNLWWSANQRLFVPLVSPHRPTGYQLCNLLHGVSQALFWCCVNYQTHYNRAKADMMSMGRSASKDQIEHEVFDTVSKQYVQSLYGKEAWWSLSFYDIDHLQRYMNMFLSPRSVWTAPKFKMRWWYIDWTDR